MKIALAPPDEKEINNYTSWLKNYNLDYEILRPNSNINKKIYLFILCGGVNVGKNLERDKRELKWIKQANKNNIHILGICRGMQIVLYSNGCVLTDIDKIFEEIHTPEKRQEKFHKVKYKNKFIEVNSKHKQHCQNINKKFKVVGKSEDGIIEMVENENNLLVQYHPELESVRNKECERLVIEWIKNIKKK